MLAYEERPFVARAAEPLSLARVAARLSLVRVAEPLSLVGAITARLVRHWEALLERPLVAIWFRHLLAPQSNRFRVRLRYLTPGAILPRRLPSACW